MFAYVCGQWLLSLVLFEIIRCIVSLPPSLSLSPSLSPSPYRWKHGGREQLLIFKRMYNLNYNNNIFCFCFSSFSPENVSRLFDLVKVKDKKYLTAFYYALTDTLVANDLDQATRIGLQVLLLYSDDIITTSCSVIMSGREEDYV